MKKIKSSLFTRIIALVAVAVLIVTSVNMPALADEDDFFPGVISPDINDGEPDPGFFIDPVLPPEPEPTPEPEPVDPCAGGHDMYLVMVERDSTCREPGLSLYECSRCGYREEKAEPQPDSSKHVMGDPEVVRAASCTDDGYTISRCVFCGEVLYEDYVPKATGHSKNGGTVVTQATCQNEGKIAYACSICGADMGSDTIPKTDHVSDGGSVVRQATTTTPGEIEYRCVNCGKILKEEHIPIIPKRERPQATFDTSSCVIYNIPDNCTVTLNGSVISNSASGSCSLYGRFPQTGDYTICVKANEYQGQAESDTQSLHVHKPAAPSHIKSTAQHSKNSLGHIGGVDTNMEYAFADSDVWVTCTSSSQPVEAGIYIVRYKATTGSIASDSIEVLVKKEKAKKSKEETPRASFNATNLHIYDVKGCRISFDGGNNWTDKLGDNTYVASEAYLNPDRGILIYRPAGDNTLDSDNQFIKITKQPAPYGLVATSATQTTLGIISNVDTGMQYKNADQKEWVNITSNPISVLPGTYYIRRMGNGNAIPSDIVTVVIKQETAVAPVVLATPTPTPTPVPTPAPVEIVVEHVEKKDTKVNEEKAEEVKKEENQEVVVEDEIEEAEEASEVLVEDVVDEGEPISSTGKKGWKEIEATFEATVEPVVINLHKDTAVPAEVFEKAVETSTELEIAASSQAVWTIEPSNVNVNDVQELGKINLGIEENTGSIPTDALATVENETDDQKVDHTFDIKHDGNFGFKARLTLKVAADPGKYANLYWYNERKGEMEYIDSAVVNEKKEATFTLSHASSYAVVISKSMMSQESVKSVAANDADNENVSAKTAESKNENSGKKKSSAAVLILVIIIFVLIAAIVFLVIFIQKKKEAKKRESYVNHHNKVDL